MDILSFNQAELETFLYVFIRVGLIIVFSPILGSATVPVKMRIGLILFISIAVFPVVKSQPMPHSRGIFELISYAFLEAMIGFTIAYAARLIFAIVQLSGTLIDFQMGFGVVNVIDPQTSSQVSITAQVQNILAIFIFLALNAHHYTIQAIVESFFIINPQKAVFSSFTMEFVMQLITGTFVTAIKLAAPLMAILFFLSVGLGLVARTVPQMNVFIIGFPLQIAAGLLMLAATMSFFSLAMQHQILTLPASFMGIMRSM
jgi:flagellar biosynthetic protein FliR